VENRGLSPPIISEHFAFDLVASWLEITLRELTDERVNGARCIGAEGSAAVLAILAEASDGDTLLIADIQVIEGRETRHLSQELAVIAIVGVSWGDARGDAHCAGRRASLLSLGGFRPHDEVILFRQLAVILREHGSRLRQESAREKTPGGDPLPPVGATLGVIAREADAILLAGRAIGLLRCSLTIVERQNAPGDDPSIARGDEREDLDSGGRDGGLAHDGLLAWVALGDPVKVQFLTVMGSDEI
jgi:hypothetical protein